jgi:hypothetical protein
MKCFLNYISNLNIKFHLTMNTINRFFLLMTMIVLASSPIMAQYVESSYYNDFRMSALTIPVYEVIPAGPPRDGIPAISHPKFAAATEADFLTSVDEVIGVVVNGVARAYPARILGYHEIVNDRIGDTPVAVTFNPLCASAMAYKSQVNKQQLAFGTSGLVYNSNSLYYDKQTESLWSQITGEAVSGPAAGAKMELLPTALVSWGEWKAKHPDTQVLTTETGYKRNYDCIPYEASSTRLLFPVSQTDKRLPLKEKIVGVAVGGRFKAYPFAMLPNGKSGITTDEFNGQSVRIEFNAALQTAFVTDIEGKPIPSATMYWFAWYAFHPETEIHGMPSKDNTAMSMSFHSTGMK